MSPLRKSKRFSKTAQFLQTALTLSHIQFAQSQSHQIHFTSLFHPKIILGTTPRTLAHHLRSKETLCFGRAKAGPRMCRTPTRNRPKPPQKPPQPPPRPAAMIDRHFLFRSPWQPRLPPSLFAAAKYLRMAAHGIFSSFDIYFLLL